MKQFLQRWAYLPRVGPRVVYLEVRTEAMYLHHTPSLVFPGQSESLRSSRPIKHSARSFVAHRIANLRRPAGYSRVSWIADVIR
jgi:hypothetical protein